MSTHSWLQADGSPSGWPAPSPSAPPPAPAPSVAPPPPPSVAPLPVPVPVPTTFSGYDAPAPDTRWNTYLQQRELPAATSQRPSVPVAAWATIAGAALVIVGCVLNWATFPSEVEAFGIPRSFNGFTKLAGESKDGPFFAVFAAILAAVGITTLLAKRVVPLLIIGTVIAAFGAAAAVIDLLDVIDPDGNIPAELDPSVGPGLPITVAGFAVVVGGLAAGLIKRHPSSS